MKTDEEAVVLSASYATYLVSRELFRITERINKIELEVVKLCETSGQQAIHEAATSLQELDFALQYTTALANYMQALSDRVSDENKMELSQVISSIPVRELALRLSCAERSDTIEIITSEPEIF